MYPDDEDSVSIDDALEETRDGTSGSTIKPLAGDYETPATPDEAGSLYPDDHPSLDTALDPSEIYEKGQKGAARSL